MGCDGGDGIGREEEDYCLIIMLHWYFILQQLHFRFLKMRIDLFLIIIIIPNGQQQQFKKPLLPPKATVVVVVVE
jgi:hypothetical protein